MARRIERSALARDSADGNMPHSLMHGPMLVTFVAMVGDFLG
jgi:hypothetical protein